METQLVRTPGTVVSHVRRATVAARRHTEITMSVLVVARSVYAGVGYTRPVAGPMLSARPGRDAEWAVANDRPTFVEPIGSSTAIPLPKVKRTPAPPG